MDDVLDTTERLLGLLSVLQGGATWTGPQLAARAGVTVRTVRRDVERLRRLGYAVESDLGADGGYRLGSGGRAVPPLVFDDDEVLALAVSARAGSASAVGGVDEAAARALAKLEQALPLEHRRTVTAVASSTERLPATGDHVDPAVLVTIGAACHGREQLRVTYRGRSGGASERRLEPYRVVNAGRRWYLVAFDLGPREWRTFRLDRIVDAHPTGHGVALVDPPDAVAFVGRAITTAPYRYRARVEVDAPLEELARRIPATVAVLEGLGPATTLVTTGADDLDVLAVHLASLDAPFRALEPVELRERLVELADRLRAAAAVSPVDGVSRGSGRRPAAGAP
jgi:predicted DNA-binding transcriptional regulator YafY